MAQIELLHQDNGTYKVLFQDKEVITDDAFLSNVLSSSQRFRQANQRQTSFGVNGHGINLLISQMASEKYPLDYNKAREILSPHLEIYPQSDGYRINGEKQRNGDWVFSVIYEINVYRDSDHKVFKLSGGKIYKDKKQIDTYTT